MLGAILLGASALSVCCGLAAEARAAEFVVADVRYTHSAQTTTDSHYRVPPSSQTPPDWTQPIDYSLGSVRVRLEVLTKPSPAPTRFQVCFEMQTNYCCTAQAPVYTAPGVYEWETPVAELWRPGPVDFRQGILKSALIVKDANNGKPAPENVGEATAALYLPTELKVTVTVAAAAEPANALAVEPGHGGRPELGSKSKSTAPAEQGGATGATVPSLGPSKHSASCAWTTAAPRLGAGLVGCMLGFAMAVWGRRRRRS